ncbi:hypothetical protein OnM2_039085 [Erysiphe neolycopersici]|uniref:Uncharacterized protein n=1 Tax=Erysiphe neolycopersici TaxID=212602 RepID=A0A420HWE7_9PEZI|nr:hypothetical protein OnM2_039085 [Erysiphe neolycopersici]
MPVCMHDNLAMKDKTVHGPRHKGKGKNSWVVPNICGVNGTETKMAFHEISLLEGSEADRLGQVNRDMFKTDPFMRYIKSHQHIRFAKHRDYEKYDAMNLLNILRVHKGRNEDCDLVLNATQNMSPNDGNLAKVEIPRISRDWAKSHKQDCQTWLFGDGKGNAFHVPAIPGVPRPKTGMRWPKSQERKRLRHKEKAEKDARKNLEKEAERAFRKSLKSAKAAKERYK